LQEGLNGKVFDVSVALPIESDAAWADRMVT
jgi:hypothetical protein